MYHHQLHPHLIPAASANASTEAAVSHTCDSLTHQPIALPNTRMHAAAAARGSPAVVHWLQLACCKGLSPTSQPLPCPAVQAPGVPHPPRLLAIRSHSSSFGPAGCGGSSRCSSRRQQRRCRPCGNCGSRVGGPKRSQGGLCGVIGRLVCSSAGGALTAHHNCRHTQQRRCPRHSSSSSTGCSSSRSSDTQWVASQGIQACGRRWRFLLPEPRPAWRRREQCTAGS